jgi:hypothetical protein
MFQFIESFCGYSISVREGRIFSMQNQNQYVNDLASIRFCLDRSTYPIICGSVQMTPV